MREYIVTVETNGVKTYRIRAISSAAIIEDFRMRGGLDHDHNPVTDTVADDIIGIEPVQTQPETKTETYERLRAYIQDITENQEPLDLLERLKP